MAERTAADLRYERKFAIFDLDVRETEEVIRFHPAAFHEVYHARWVNNVYFDTPSLDYYHDNVRGIARRVKCRIRWYGTPRGPVERPVLELKRKNGLLGTKESHPLRPFDLESDFDPRRLFDKSDLPTPLRHELACLRPTLLNRYRRRYFASHDERFRLTLDSELGYQAVGRRVNRFPTWVGNDGRVIVELKFGVGHEDEASRIASRFPFRVTRSSKYVIGIEALYA
jgi:hypothetical protein